MKEAYPIFVKQKDDTFLVYVPDMEIYTEGDSFADAMAMARDAIGLKGVEFIEDGSSFPEASDSNQAKRKAEKDADEIFDYSDGILTFVDVDFANYRNKLRNRAVKKNCTIPYWLNEEAESRGVNFSKVLQDALVKIVDAG